MVPFIKITVDWRAAINEGRHVRCGTGGCVSMYHTLNCKMLQRIAVRVWRRYVSILDSRPLLTQAITTGNIDLATFNSVRRGFLRV